MSRDLATLNDPTGSFNVAKAKTGSSVFQGVSAPGAFAQFLSPLSMQSRRNGLTFQRPVAVVADFEIGTVEDFLHELEAIFKRREECVAFDEPLDQREKKIGAQRQGLRVNLRAAADEDLTGIVG